MTLATLFLAFVAGFLTVLSPCVLPLIPMVLAGAAAEHRFAPIALALGVGLSFALIGAVLAAVGQALGIDFAAFRILAAVVLLALGAILLFPSLQTQLSMASGLVANWVQQRFGSTVGATSGLSGQFALGLLLGAVWTPCVGPTLGAASVLAARGENLLAVTITMLMFGLGTGLALALMGLASRALLISWRHRMLSAGHWGKAVMGGLIVLIGLGVLTGLDRNVEALLVEASPPWLTQLTTTF